MSVLAIPSLYLHVPFCVKRCDYCAFYTLADSTAPMRAGYLDRLKQEIAAAAPSCGPLQHIYVGGGTPTFLSHGELRRLFDGLFAHMRLDAGAEFSVEANPQSLTDETLDLLLGYGVTRISLGAQSFNDRVRTAIGRYGEADAVVAAVARLRSRGVVNYNLDLIYGAPEQTLADLEVDLERFLEMEPAHISTYSLMVEPGTPLARRGTTEAADDLLADMWTAIGERLAAAGIHRYEVSNHARPGHECRHNRHVWYGGPFMGIGPSASWYDGDSRWTNVADLKLWQGGRGPIEDRLQPEHRAREILAYGLRVATGWQRPAFRAATGYDYRALCGETLDSLAADGMIVATDDSIRIPTEKLILADYVARELL